MLPSIDRKALVNFAAWFPIFVAMVVLSVAMLVHLATHEVPYMPKWAWALFILIAMPLGSFVYLAVVIAGAGVQRDDAEGRSPRT
jgi:hypothetical protein